MVGVIFENEGLLLNDGVTLLTDVLPEAPSFLAVMTWTAEMAGKHRRENQNARMTTLFVFTIR